MKKLLFILVILIISVTISCKWQVPEKVSVKTKADYEFGVGRVNKSLDEYLDLTKMLGENVPEGMAVYDYFPGEKDPGVQHYLMQVAKEIPFDLTDVKNQISQMDKILEPIPVNQNIAVDIPKIEMPPFEIPITFTGVAENVNNALRGVGSVTSKPVNIYPLDAIKDKLSIGSVVYKAGGTFTVDVKLISDSPAIPITIPSDLRVFVDFDGNGSKDFVELSKSGNTFTYTFLSQTEIAVNDAKIKFESSTALPENGIDINTLLQSGSITIPDDPATTSCIMFNTSVSGTIDKVTNLTLYTPETSDPADTVQSFSPDKPFIKEMPEGLIPSGKGIELVTVGQGNFGIEFIGITADFEIGIETEGAVALSQTLTKAKPSIDLNNKTIMPGQFKVTVTPKFDLKDITIEFDKEPKVQVKPSITNIAEVKANIAQMSPGFTADKLNITKTFDLPAEIQKMVRTIGVNPSGVKLSYTNTLPAGNDITLIAESKFLGIKKNVDIKSGVTDAVAEVLCDAHDIQIAKEGPLQMDFNVKVQLPGATSPDSTIITLKNIPTTGLNCTINIKEAVPVLDWNYVKADTSGLTEQLPESARNMTMNMGVNLNEMLAGLGETLGDPHLFDNVGLEKLPVYLFCALDGIEALNSLGIEGVVKLYFAEGDTTVQIPGTKTGYILGSLGVDEAGLPVENSGELKLVNKFPTITKNDKGIVTQDVSLIKDVSFSTESSNESKLVDFIPELLRTNGNLCLGMNINNLTTTSGDGIIQINKADLDKLGAESKVRIQALVDLGLALSLPKGLKINLLNIPSLKDTLAGQDVLKGNITKLKEQGLDKVLAAIKSVGVKYTLNSFPVKLPQGKDINFYMGFNSIPEKKIGLLGGNDIKITSEEVKGMFSKDTLEMNKMSVEIPAGVMSIPRDKNVDLNISVGIATDGTITLYENGAMAIGGGAKNEKTN